MYDAFKTVVVLTDTTIGRLRYHNDGGGKTSLKIKKVYVNSPGVISKLKKRKRILSSFVYVLNRT